ncbi:MAG: hypothetical protein NTZ33_07030 [Bacteroidetes bacterium]|nr:hypothetical protein [Bacteroidota bacterium]
MKTIKLLIITIVILLAASTQAQISVNLNIGSPPRWGPAGYNDVQYYYLPDVESYYDVRASMFIYFSGGVWIHRSYLPGRYRNYDLYGGYKVVMNDYHGNRPYEHFNEHRMKYKKGYHDHMQKNIGERPGRGNNKGRMNSEGRSYKKENKGHDRNKSQGHGNEMKNDPGRGHDNGKEKGHGKGK